MLKSLKIICKLLSTIDYPNITIESGIYTFIAEKGWKEGTYDLYIKSKPYNLHNQVSVEITGKNVHCNNNTFDIPEEIINELMWKLM
jgi:hypothetical protein